MRPQDVVEHLFLGMALPIALRAEGETIRPLSQPLLGQGDFAQAVHQVHLFRDAVGPVEESWLALANTSSGFRVGAASAGHDQDAGVGSPERIEIAAKGGHGDVAAQAGEVVLGRPGLPVFIHLAPVEAVLGVVVDLVSPLAQQGNHLLLVLVPPGGRDVNLHWFHYPQITLSKDITGVQ